MKNSIKTSFTHLYSGCNTLQDYQRIILKYNEMIRKNPRDFNTLKDRAIVKHRMGDLQGALDDFNKYLHLKPNNPNVIAYVTQIENEMKNFQTELAGAIQLFQKKTISDQDKSEPSA